MYSTKFITPILCLILLTMLGSWIATDNRPATPTQDMKLVALIEKEFYRNLTAIDREQGRKLTTQFKKIFKKHSLTPYSLYREITAAKKQAKQEAIQQARNSGYKDRMYTNYIDAIQGNHVGSILKKYGISIDLRNAFNNNYCSCYTGKLDQYCKEGKCSLPDGVFW